MLNNVRKPSVPNDPSDTPSNYKSDIAKLLPSYYHILPHIIPFRIPGFYKSCPSWLFTLSPEKIDSIDWFDSFKSRIVHALHGGRFLPVCRLSDGEFTFLFGPQPPSPRWPIQKRCVFYLKYLYRKLFKKSAFSAIIQNRYRAGKYSNREVAELRSMYSKRLKYISEKGILAMHLTYALFPFEEHFFPAIGKWLIQNKIILTTSTYVPFYFVYALLTGPEKQCVIKGHNILLVTSADSKKQMAIEKTLFALGARDIQWLLISPDRSAYDTIDIKLLNRKVDIAFVGAGVGKPNVILQLEPLNIPVVDAGYVFEVWADENAKWNRIFCVPDSEFDIKRVKFLPQSAK